MKRNNMRMHRSLSLMRRSLLKMIFCLCSSPSLALPLHDCQIEYKLRTVSIFRWIAVRTSKTSKGLLTSEYDPRIRVGCHKPSHNPIKAIVKLRREYLCGVLLLMSALVANITYQSAFSLLGGTLNDGYTYSYAANGTLQLRKQDSIIVNRSFILLNSTGFVASVAVIIFLLHEFPLKPWPQISVSTFFGSYMCLIMATSSREAFALLFLAIPFLLLAAAGKLNGFARQRSY